MNKLKPHITEKSVTLTKSGKFTILVDYSASKKEIEALVKKIYKVSPKQINIIKTKYLADTRYRKNFLNRGLKKAVIALEKGKSIPGFEFENKDDKDKKANKKDKKVSKTNDKES